MSKILSVSAIKLNSKFEFPIRTFLISKIIFPFSPVFYLNAGVNLLNILVVLVVDSKIPFHTSPYRFLRCLIPLISVSFCDLCINNQCQLLLALGHLLSFVTKIYHPYYSLRS